MSLHADIDMHKRIARYSNLKVIESQRNMDVPQEVMDIVASRELKPVITTGQDADAPFGATAPIVGAGGISITYAICPENTGPSLHSHHRTHETFTVMQGVFEFIWGDAGENSSILLPFDTISVPPGIHRAFKNAGEGEGVLQVIISGGVHDHRDIFFPKSTREEIREIDEQSLSFLENDIGLEFNDR